MGAKLSNFSTNSKHLHNFTSNLQEDLNLSGDDHTLPCYSSREPPIVDKHGSDDCIENELSKFQQYGQCLPNLFPKITMDTESVPISNTNSFRIHPIKQQGVKVSDTHYWIINDPKHKRCYSAKVNRHPPEMYINTKVIINEPYEEPQLPYDLNQQISQEYIRTKPLKRGQSENHKECLLRMHRGMVVRMMMTISSASEMECNSVLIGANWNYEVAEKRLKVDMLHRKGFVNQLRCTQMLERYKWDLKRAEQQAEKEHRLMQYQRQHLSQCPRFEIREDT